jgi:putative glycosyltransferase (TIGR04372 family)
VKYKVGELEMTTLGVFEVPIPPLEEKYFNIFGALLHTPVGDFIDHVLYCASVRALIPDARLDVYYRPDRPYKEAIVSMTPGIDQVWASASELPLNLFDITSTRSPIGPDSWYEHGCATPNLIVLPHVGNYSAMAGLPRITRFKVPDSQPLDEELGKRVGPGWFVVLHYHESGYRYRDVTPARAADLSQIPKIVDRIIALGGQVVRIGHPAMVELEPRPGFIDLKDAGFLLQAQAIARARCFFEVSSSGPASLALALGVPTARCNVVDVTKPGLMKTQGFLMPKRIIHRSGDDMTRHLVETNQINRRSVESHPDLEFRDLELPELYTALDHLLDISRDSDGGWRDDTPPPPEPPIEGFLPGPATAVLSYLIL